MSLHLGCCIGPIDPIDLIDPMDHIYAMDSIEGIDSIDVTDLYFTGCMFTTIVNASSWLLWAVPPHMDSLPLTFCFNYCLVSLLVNFSYSYFFSLPLFSMCKKSWVRREGF